MKKLIVLLTVLGLIFAALALPALAGGQQWVLWHHESQGHGPNDQTQDLCLPDDSIGGHDGHDGDYQISGPYSNNRCVDDPTDNPPTDVPPTDVPPTDVSPTDAPTDDPTKPPCDDGQCETPVTPQATTTIAPPATATAKATSVPGCRIDVQGFAVVSDLPANAAYMAIAYSPKPPNLVTQEDEGEVANLYVVNNGGVEAIQPKGHQTPFLALAVNGSAEIDGNAYVYKCTGSVFLNLYDAAGNFLGHPQLRWDGVIAKGFHAPNSGLQGIISFLDLGVLPK